MLYLDEDWKNNYKFQQELVRKYQLRKGDKVILPPKSVEAHAHKSSDTIDFDNWYYFKILNESRVYEYPNDFDLPTDDTDIEE
jgi:hypothetical protein